MDVVEELSKWAHGVELGERPAARPLIRILRRARDEIVQTREALAGVVGLAQLLLARDDLPWSVREALTRNHRMVEARRLVMGTDDAQSPPA